MSRFPEMGERLRQTRRGARMTTEAVATQMGISRALLHRYECGDIVKLDTLERLAALYGTSINALLGIGVGSEYIRNGITFFERLLRIEEHATDITSVIGPITYLLTSDDYDSALWENLINAGNNPGTAGLRPVQIDHLMYIFRKRKQNFIRNAPKLTSIVPMGDIKRYLRFGWWEHEDTHSAQAKRSRQQAYAEMCHLVRLLTAAPLNVQIGLTDSPLTTGGFSSFSLPKRQVSMTSPFRLGAPINIQFGIATFSDDADSVRGHEDLAAHIWQTALKGTDAVDRLRTLIREYGNCTD
jgi:transcriptional regulator with XRE-family HTH domain